MPWEFWKRGGRPEPRAPIKERGGAETPEHSIEKPPAELFILDWAPLEKIRHIGPTLLVAEVGEYVAKAFSEYEFAGEEDLLWLKKHPSYPGTASIHTDGTYARLVFFGAREGNFVSTLASEQGGYFRRSSLDLRLEWNPSRGRIVMKRRQNKTEE